MGTLFIVATPIGNLKDITLRSIEILKDVDYILCEDTRVTGKLLNAYDISKKMVVFNDFNEERLIDSLVGELQNGANIALVSDAGTPLVSDPGFKLIREIASKNIKIEVLPGASAMTAALVMSGLPTDKFLFLGFLPKKNGKKEKLLQETKEAILIVKATVIIYESPFRVLKTLDQIKSVFGDIDVAVCRELTKIHEEVLRGRISEISTKLKIKGEFVIVF
jgi:16S rRNA (cytidine1402-2'-O)-methyltransferase